MPADKTNNARSNQKSSSHDDSSIAKKNRSNSRNARKKRKKQAGTTTTAANKEKNSSSMILHSPPKEKVLSVGQKNIENEKLPPANLAKNDERTKHAKTTIIREEHKSSTVITNIEEKVNDEKQKPGKSQNNNNNNNKQKNKARNKNRKRKNSNANNNKNNQVEVEKKEITEQEMMNSILMRILPNEKVNGDQNSPVLENNKQQTNQAQTNKKRMQKNSNISNNNNNSQVKSVNRDQNSPELENNKQQTNDQTQTNKKRLQKKNSDVNNNRNNNQVKSQKKKSKKEAKKTFIEDPAVIRELISSRIHQLPPDRQQRMTHHLDWNAIPIPYKDEERMAKTVVTKGEYGPLKQEDIERIEHYIQASNTPMGISQAISLRTCLLQEKVLQRHFSLQNKAKVIYQRYKQGCTVVDLAREMDFPPMNTLRLVLSEMKLTKKAIQKCFRDPTKHLKGREQNEYRAAEASDIISNFNQESALVFANAFEAILSDFLQQKNICFVRQSALEKEQKELFGKAIATPDFLLLDDVTINGKIVRWIDAKAFYGAFTKFNRSKMKKQTSRYIDHWGSGAIVYLQGFSEQLTNLDGCLLLNAHGEIAADALSTLTGKLSSSLNKASSCSKSDQTPAEEESA